MTSASARRPLRPASRSKAEKQDDSIMGTNQSSIVSKRSVEYLYYPEPHFFRYFVRKKQRRSPPINRGYWLRMKAIDHAVYHFLRQSPGTPKAIINLGCGYDPLPWQCLTKYPDLCANVKFIDTDYVDLMRKKCSIVLETPQLTELLTNLEPQTSIDIMLRSDQYFQIGCDLRDTSKLSKLLADIIDLGATQVLFTAEVSITYMDQASADSLISWAASLPSASFALLEQIIPVGDSHPFSQVMLAHFDKLQTSLGSVRSYPTKHAQNNRFQDRGWQNVQVRDLWDLWSSEDYVSTSERQSLDEVEPFDEWEEFAIFCRHYFLLVASNSRSQLGPSSLSLQESTTTSLSLSKAHIIYNKDSKEYSQRRFGAAMPVRATTRDIDVIAAYGGIGSKTWSNSCDLYRCSDKQNLHFPQMQVQMPFKSPPQRMSHSITDLGDTGSLLVGGRTSPDKAYVDCWLYHKWVDIWERVDDLPQPLYRHTAVAVGHSEVLVFGGKLDSKTFSSAWLLWTRRHGWTCCKVESSVAHPAISGAAMASISDRSGVLVGGITQSGIINDRIWRWRLTGSTSSPILNLSEIDQNHQCRSHLARFGSTLLNRNGTLWMIGGVANDSLLHPDEEILSIYDIQNDGNAKVLGTSLDVQEHPIFVGVAASAVGRDILITGGGAICFSFGVYWNQTCYTLKLNDCDTNRDVPPGDTIQENSRTWRGFVAKDTDLPARPAQTVLRDGVANGCQRTTVVVPRVQVTSAESFNTILRSDKPVILEGLNIGECTHLWTNDYLKDQIGRDRKVVVHSAATENMDFNTKNFEYRTLAFGDVIDAIEKGEHLYLRALATEQPSKVPANINNDYPSISADFELPQELEFVSQNLHSSPLRISGPVRMWLHYDVMANVLCQIRGAKRLLLFPPGDVTELGLAPGTSSSSLDVFDEGQLNALTTVTPHEATLKQGDVLFLPALWLHSAAPMDGISVAVNVFFRSLETGYAAGRDVYGNRDIQAYEKGRQDVSKISKSFQNLPIDMRLFYLRRLAMELAASAQRRG